MSVATKDDATLRTLRLTNTILGEMIKGSRLEDLLDVIHREMRDIVPLDRIAITLKTGQGDELMVAALRTEGAVHLPIGYILSAGDPRLRQVVKLGETCLIDDLDQFLVSHPESDSTRRLVLEGMRSNLAVPLRMEGQIIG